MKPKKREMWPLDAVRQLKKMAGKKPVRQIAKTLKRSEGATRQKAFAEGVSLRRAA